VKTTRLEVSKQVFNPTASPQRCHIKYKQPVENLCAETVTIIIIIIIIIMIIRVEVTRPLCMFVNPEMTFSGSYE